MKVSFFIQRVINSGPYESTTVKAGVEVDTFEDFEEIPTDEEVGDYLREVVNRVIEPELERARKNPATADDSHIYNL